MESNVTLNKQIKQRKNIIYSNGEQCNTETHKQTMNTCNDASSHTATNVETWSHLYTETKPDHTWVGVARWTFMVQLKQRLMYQDEVMNERWQHERCQNQKIKKVSVFKFEKFNKWTTLVISKFNS